MLVSPMFSGTEGINNCTNCLHKIEPYYSEGSLLNIRIDVSGRTFEEILKICLNFIKYEDAMDNIFISQQKKESKKSHLKSNKKEVEGKSNKERHVKVESCKSKQELRDCMNPDQSSDYKLNLQNFVNSDTVEFRFTTLALQKVMDWIQFCLYFVDNSIRFRTPSWLKDSRTVQEQQELLFQYVIKNRNLKKSLGSSSSEKKDVDCSASTVSSFVVIHKRDCQEETKGNHV